MVEEIWKVIEDFPNYEVSNKGRVRNRKSGRILKPALNNHGYYKVDLYKSGERKSYPRRIHRLVMDVFVGPNADLQVNHIDGDKLNNCLENLEWCTGSENIRHAIANNLFSPGKYQSKPVKIIETGEIFNGPTECARAIGGNVQNISACLNKRGRYTVNGLHFEYTDTNVKKEPVQFLYPYQMEAVKQLRNGCILCGSVGSGKSRTGLFYYFKEQGGWIEDGEYTPMKNPKDLFIITTAKKRDSLEWVRELTYYRMHPDPELNYYKNKIVIDSWNNLPKYKDVTNAFFLLDEQRLIGSGAWVKTFLKLAKANDWILLTATPADTYMDYLPVFLANGFFKNKTEFNREHVQFARYAKYPKIERFHNTGRLDRLRDRVLVQMNYKHEINTHHEYVYCSYDISKYKDVIRNRWDPFKNEPIEQASNLCYILRRIVNSDQTRQVKLLELLENIPRAIIFYSFDYERDILLNLAYGEGVEVAEWNGHAHCPIPDSPKWVYICQYTSACEGWECVKTDSIIFYSQNYSYKVMTQAAGRIDRLNSPYNDLYYYHLCSRSGIDLAISKALSQKKKFNERKWVKWD